MSLNLHKNALNLMKEQLENSVGTVRVENGNWVDGASAFFASYFANEKIPKTGKVYEKLLEFVDDMPFVEFVIQTLRRDILDSQDYVVDAKAALNEIPGFNDTHVLAESLVSRFNSLLWNYTFSLDLPDAFFPPEVIAEGLPAEGHDFRVIGSDLFLDQTFPLTHENERVANRAKPRVGLLALAPPVAVWTKDRAHFQSEIDGFVGVYGGTPTVRAIENRLESFVALGIANRIFRYQYKYDNKPIKKQWIVHRKVEDRWEFDSRFDVEVSVLDVLSHIDVFKFEDSYPVASRPIWIRNRMKTIRDVFASEESSSIILSAKWLFDSYKRTDDSLTFVRLMTSLEILLGERLDTSRASIGETIGNRLAYLIGKDRKDRNEILDYFKNVYRTRSKILHNGKHRLIGEEKLQLSRLRDYVLRAILAECDALATDA